MSVNFIRRAICFAGLGAIIASTMLAPSSAVAQDDGPLRFGLAMPFTGSQALFGTDQGNAAIMAVKDINEKGGVAGRKLEVIGRIMQTGTVAELFGNKLLSQLYFGK